MKILPHHETPSQTLLSACLPRSLPPPSFGFNGQELGYIALYRSLHCSTSMLDTGERKAEFIDKSIEEANRDAGAASFLLLKILPHHEAPSRFRVVAPLFFSACRCTCRRREQKELSSLLLCSSRSSCITTDVEAGEFSFNGQQRFHYNTRTTQCTVLCMLYTRLYKRCVLNIADTHVYWGTLNVRICSSVQIHAFSTAI